MKLIKASSILRKTVLLMTLATAIAAPSFAAGKHKAAKPVKRYNAKNAIVDTGKKNFSDSITAEELAVSMKAGWNLGNTLDATNGRGLNSETSWGQPKTTKKMFEDLAASGITTVRIPVSWHNHMDSSYTIDSRWMNRVKEVVDWALDAGLYVILNTHHDQADSSSVAPGEGYYPSYAAEQNSVDFVYNAWLQISAAFNTGYDEHLIFELINEPRLKNTANEWNFNASSADCLEAADMIGKMEEAALQAIRKSGKNNAKRFVMVTPYCASPDAALSDSFRIPGDTAKNRLLLSVHMYTPYEFAMQDPGAAVFSNVHKSQIADYFTKLEKKFAYNGIPIVIGETGATNKNNTEEREKWFSFFFSSAKEKGMAVCLWDNGNAFIGPDGKFDEHFGFFNRTEGTWYFETLKDAMVNDEK